MKELYSYFVAATSNDPCSFTTRQAWHALVGAYTEPHRCYHTLEHLEQLIFDHNKLMVPLTRERLLTIFYHDVVYASMPTTISNEKASALTFEAVAQRWLDLPLEMIQAVASEIRATEYKQGSTGEFGDFDFFSMAFEDRRRRGSWQIRNEHFYVSDEQFCKGRRDFLATLSHGCFKTPRFKDYEAELQRLNKLELELLFDYPKWVQWCLTSELP